MLVAVWLAAAPAAHAFDVTIRRTSHGIPHVYARDYASLGYGYAYAFAQDDLCQIADSYVTVGAQRSRFFGPDNSWRFEGNGTVVNNLNSDFFYQRVNDTKIGGEAGGPAAARRAQAGGQGHRARLRRRLQRLPAPHRRRQAARPDAARASRGCARSTRWTSTGASTSSPRWPARGWRWTGSASAAPLAGGDPREQRRPARAGVRRALGHRLQRLRPGQAGAPTTAAAWCWATRISPGRAPSASTSRSSRSPASSTWPAASLYGVPLINIGHDAAAWPGAIPSRRRAASRPYEEKLVPGSPTSYLHDGQVEQMKADRVTVKLPRRATARARCTRPATGRCSPRCSACRCSPGRRPAPTRWGTPTRATSAISTTSSTSTAPRACASWTASSAATRASRG